MPTRYHVRPAGVVVGFIFGLLGGVILPGLASPVPRTRERREATAIRYDLLTA